MQLSARFIEVVGRHARLVESLRNLKECFALANNASDAEIAHLSRQHSNLYMPPGFQLWSHHIADSVSFDCASS